MSRAAARKHLAQRVREEAKKEGLSPQERARRVREAVARIPILESDGYPGVRASGRVVHPLASHSGSLQHSFTPPQPRKKVDIPFDIALEIARTAFPRGDDFNIPTGIGCDCAMDVTNWPAELSKDQRPFMTYKVRRGFGHGTYIRREGDRDRYVYDESPILKVLELVQNARVEFARKTENKGVLSSVPDIVGGFMFFGGLAGVISGIYLYASSTLAGLGSVLSGLGVAAVIAVSAITLTLKKHFKIKTPIIEDLARKIQELGPEKV